MFLTDFFLYPCMHTHIYVKCMFYIYYMGVYVLLNSSPRPYWWVYVSCLQITQNPSNCNL